MISRENRVLLVTTLLAIFAAGLVALYGPSSYSAFLSILALAGIGLVVPQLYLATNGDGLSVTRIRTGVLVGAGYALFLGSSTGDETLHTLFGVAITEERLVIGFVAVLVLGLLAYELVTGFRETTGQTDEST